jgi:3-hydroxyacyl-CoA dehydrogenase / enoyl-CoA hydratase / 3-hydroxybutyryl-CoA epimerase
MALFQTKHLWIDQVGDDIAVLILDRHQTPTNFLDLELLSDLERALDAVVQANRHRLLILRSGKEANFCHGPSPALLKDWTKDDFRTWSERGQKLCARLAELPIPSACLIAGSCFDAGLELALACDYRVVVNKATTVLGFPELEWGMIPCWGGTQRLPRLIGLDHSLGMLLAGQRLDAREVWTQGLADDFAEDGDEEPPSFLESPRKRDWSLFPTRTWRERWLESNRPGRWFLFRGAERILHTRIPDEMIAPAQTLAALRLVYQFPDLQAGLDFERRAVERIVEHPALGNLIRLLTHREQLRPPLLGSNEKNRIRQVGIVGTSVAGLALLLHSVTKGYEVVLKAENEETLGAGLSQVVQLLQLEVQHGAMTPAQFQKTLAAIRGTHTWTHFDKLDLIVDTSEGSLIDKQSFYRDVEAHVPAGAVLVATSPLHRVEDVRAGLKRPNQVIGMRLIEPWNRGSLAELVAGGAAPTNVQRVRDWSVNIGKCCLQTPDRVGGIVMRVWMPALNEAGILIKEGVPIDRIDHAMRRFGMSFGPCEWMDRLGVDLIAALVSAMQPIFAGRLNLETGFARMVDKQWLGNKTGTGFYQPGFRKRKPNREAPALWQASQGEAPQLVPGLAAADEHAWIQRRLVTLMALEALRVLDEGLVKDADDLDCAMCLTGWATHRGGPVGYARQLGTDAMAESCAELTRQHGKRFAPVLEHKKD